jgi:hypothetical protein
MLLYKAFKISVGGTLLAIAANPYKIRTSASKNITLKKTPIVRRIFGEIQVRSLKEKASGRIHRLYSSLTI